MKDRSHVEEVVAKEITPHLSEMKSPDPRAKAAEIIDWYKKNFSKVQIVRCERCGADLCLEILDPAQASAYAHAHHDGMRRITLGNDLLSSRKRLDGIMGYECRCGNNTINASVELGIVPTVENPSGPDSIPAIEPHHEAAVRIEIASQGYKPNVKMLGNKKVLDDSFSVEVV